MDVNEKSSQGERVISDEKRKWLKKIGAAEFPEPIKFIYRIGDSTFNLSERYIVETPLLELVHQYEENIAHIECKRCCANEAEKS